MSAYENALFGAENDWSFADFGVEFDTHVARHLPGYFDVQRLIGLVAQVVVPERGTIADLGCSTGQTARTLGTLLSRRHPSIYLYDDDPSMMVEAKRNTMMTPAFLHYRQVDLIAGEMDHEGADLTTMLWLLQFIDPKHWYLLLRQARQRSSPDGVLLVAAKTHHPDVRFEKIAEAALDDYKSEAGVSAQERAAKTRSLRGMLHAATTRDYASVMVRAGWSPPTLLWRWHVWSVLGSFAREDA